MSYHPFSRSGVLARLLASRLDARLAAGASPGSDRLLATRAAQLTDPGARRTLADAWDEVVQRAARPMGVLDPRVPVAPRTRDAAPEIGALTWSLRNASSPAARDIVRARAVLTDGTGPVYTGAPGLQLALRQLVGDLWDVGQVAERSLTSRS